MTTKTIDQATSADLRGSLAALQRAAQRARELAAQTGTELVVGKNGIIERIKPQLNTVSHPVQETPAPYKDMP
ncbi:hypothetical protein JKG47_01850 [Acidithiobacillus sp. MC6.1]|nr:hypothetical protein [Acidithiobacillus sp. MC6.1]